MYDIVAGASAACADAGGIADINSHGCNSNVGLAGIVCVDRVPGCEMPQYAYGAWGCKVA